MRTALEQEQQHHNATCWQMILDFNASMGRATRDDTHVVERVREYCHAAMDVSHPYRLHAEMVRQQKLEANSVASTSADGSAQIAAMSWRYHGLDLSTPWQSRKEQRLPRLAYVVLISPTDSPAAG